MTGLIPFNRKHNDIMNVGFDDFSNMLDDFFTAGIPTQRSLARDTFKIDIQDSDNEFTIEAELPGVKKENIEITLNEGKLTLSVTKEATKEDDNKKYIHRERKFSQMSRSIVLVEADEEGIQAKLSDGVLTLIVPKKKKVDTTKRITIE